MSERPGWGAAEPPDMSLVQGEDPGLEIKVIPVSEREMDGDRLKGVANDLLDASPDLDKMVESGKFGIFGKISKAGCTVIIAAGTLAAAAGFIAIQRRKKNK